MLWHFYRKVAVWIPSQKVGQFAAAENFSLGRMSSFSVTILFNHQIFRTSHFRSWGGCCVCLTSACCTKIWNKNSFSLSCSWKCWPWRRTEIGTLTKYYGKVISNSQLEWFIPSLWNKWEKNVIYCTGHRKILHAMLLFSVLLQNGFSPQENQWIYCIIAL